MANTGWQSFIQGNTPQNFQPTARPTSWQEFNQPQQVSQPQQEQKQPSLISKAKPLATSFFSTAKSNITGFIRSVPEAFKEAKEKPEVFTRGLASATSKTVTTFAKPVGWIQSGIASVTGTTIPERWDISKQAKEFNKLVDWNAEPYKLEAPKAFMAGEVIGHIQKFAFEWYLARGTVGKVVEFGAAKLFAPKVAFLAPKIATIATGAGLGQIDYDEENDGTRVQKLRSDIIVFGLFEAAPILTKGLSKATSKLVSSTFNKVSRRLKTGESIEIAELENTVQPAKEAIVQDTGKNPQALLVDNTTKTSNEKLASVLVEKPKIEEGKVVDRNVKDLVSHEGAPDKEQIAKYVEEIKSGGRPPVTVIKEGNKFGIEDGKHRFEAYKQLGITEIPTVEKIIQPKIVESANAKVVKEAIGSGDISGAKALYKDLNDATLPAFEKLQQEVAQAKIARTGFQTLSQEKVTNVRNIKDVKATLKNIRGEYDNLLVEAEGKSILAKETRGVFSDNEAKNITKLKKIYWSSDKYQGGDIGTMQNSKTEVQVFNTVTKQYEKTTLGKLLNKTVENIQEMNPKIKSDDEAYEFIKNFPTKGEEALGVTPDLRALAQKEKTLRNYLDILQSKQKELGVKQDDALYQEWQQVLKTQEALAKIIEVPRRQLPVGEGKEKLSRLEERVAKSLAEAPEDVKNLSTFNQMNKKDQIAKATAFVTNNPDDALAILTGEKEAPAGILNNSIYVALYNKGKTDITIATKLATLPSTRGGQEISILTELNPHSPVKYMSELVKFREKVFTQKYGAKSSKDMTGKVITEIKASVKLPTKNDWGTFIKSIEC